MGTEDEIESRFGSLEGAETEDICKESTWLVVQNVMVFDTQSINRLQWDKKLYPKTALQEESKGNKKVK